MAVLIYILCIVCNREVKSFWKPLNHGCDSVFEDVLRCVSPSYSPGWGSRPLIVFSPVSGGPPERPVALTCVAQTGVVSPGGDEQATRYYPPSLIRARG